MICRTRRLEARRIFNECAIDLHLPNDWTFVIDERPRKRVGQCRYRKREIGLSAWAVDSTMPMDEIEDTIRHEIAHALVGPGHGHDGFWKRMAENCGATPEACASIDEDHLPEPLWRGTCQRCGYVFTRHRLKRRWRKDGNSYHDNCRGKIAWRKTR